ncbi:unnamed protein product [Peniophora sp. CBMAI 1063]|nr:unnamed protein product [Peniophora sp. CBMAI 1063]
MQSGYSSIFASGLLATPRPSRHGSGEAMDTDTTPTSSKTYTTNFTNPFPPHGQDADMTSGDADYFTSRSRASSTASTDSTAPRLRRRRSSLTVNPNANPLASVRSPLRSAGAAFQRNLIGGARSRSGSVSTEPANDGHAHSTAPANTIKGRTRSGSLGTALRSSRKASRKPPPAMPLPALPPLPPSATNEAFPTTPTRRPLFHRAHNSDNNAALTFGQSSAYMRTDIPVPMKLQTGGVTPMDSMHPSPVDPVAPFTTTSDLSLLSAFSTSDIAWVTALTTTGAAVAGYALGRLDRRRKRARPAPPREEESDVGTEEEVAFEEPAAGTRKRKLTVQVVASVRFKRARRSAASPVSLQTPEVVPARRILEEDLVLESDTALTETGGSTLRRTRATAPPPTTPIGRSHTLTGLLTPAGSSDYYPEDDAQLDGTHLPDDPPLSGSSDLKLDASALDDSDTTTERVRSTSELLHAILPTASTESRSRTPPGTHERLIRQSFYSRSRRRALPFHGSARVINGYESGISAPPSDDSDSDYSYHEGSDASSYDSRASSPGLNVPSDEETFWDESDAESDEELAGMA